MSFIVVSGVRARLKPIAQSQPKADLSVIFGCYFTSQALGIGSLVLPFDYVVYMEQMHNMGKVQGGENHLCSQNEKWKIR